MGVIAFMPLAFPIIVNQNFNDAYFQIPILMVATIFNILVIFLGSIYVAKKLTKEVAKTSIIAAVINLVINLCFVKFIGLYAASISTLIAYVTIFLYRIVDSRKYVKLQVAKSLVCSLILITTFCCFSYYLNIFALNLFTAILAVVYSIFVNRNSARYMFNLVKNKFLHNNSSNIK